MKNFVIVALLTLAFASETRAEEPAPLLQYFAGWHGDWAVSDSGDVVGSITISGDPSAQCLTIKGRFDDAGFDEILGYDPADEAWKTTGFDTDGERYEYTLDGFPSHDKPRKGDSWTAKIHGVKPDGTKTSADLRWTVVDPIGKVELHVTNELIGDEAQDPRTLTYQRYDYIEYWKPLSGKWQNISTVGETTSKGTFEFELLETGRSYLSMSTAEGMPAQQGINTFDPSAGQWVATTSAADGSLERVEIRIHNMHEVFPLGSGATGSYTVHRTAPDGSTTHTEGDWTWEVFDGQKGTLLLFNTQVDGIPQPDTRQQSTRVE